MEDYKIKRAILNIEKACKENEVGDGTTNTVIDTDKFYDRIMGLMEIVRTDPPRAKGGTCA